MKIGITERGDAGLDFSWMKYKGYKILITKNPVELLKNCYTSDFNNSIVHCTITGLGGTVYEPNVIKPTEAIDAYTKLVETLGVERVVLRVDPIFPNENFWLNYHKPIIEQCKSRLRISFLDMYNHTRNNLHNLYINDKHKNIHADLDIRLYYLNKIKEIYSDVEVCGEPDIECLGCVSERDFKALGIATDKIRKNKNKQRNSCKCVGNKFELLNNPNVCNHGCLYCYWYIDKNKD